MHPVQFARGRHRDPCGSDRLPWATGLVSYPSSHIFGSHAADSLLGSLPRFGSYRTSVVIAGVSGASLAECSIRGVLILFPRSGCDTGLFRRLALFVQNRRMTDYHTGSQ